MPVTRRRFLQHGALAASGLLLPPLAGARMRGAPVPLSVLDPTRLKPFVDALPIPKVAKPLGKKTLASAGAIPLPHYEIEMRRCEARVHRDLGPTEFWGYDGTFP